MKNITRGHRKHNIECEEIKVKEEKRKGELMTINAIEFMKILGLSRNTFKKNLRAGKLPKPLPMAGSCRRWAIDDVKSYLNSNSNTTEL